MDKYLIFAAIIIGILTLFSCTKPPQPAYFQKNMSLPEEQPTALRCQIGSTTYYQQSFFIYHVNTLGDQVVYSPVGSYTMPRDYERWQYRMFISKNDSLYNQTLKYIQDRKQPNGAPVLCNETRDTPRDFRVFITDHEPLFRANLYKKSTDIEI